MSEQTDDRRDDRSPKDRRGHEVACGVPRSIGLALSGGGYRAMAFHLGALSYLEQRKLLSRVRLISTVSGGTFVGAGFALSLTRGQTFRKFFLDFYREMETVDLVGRGLELLGGPPPNVPSQRHDLIVAMAQVYSETFFRNPDGEPYRFGELLDSETQLSDAVFNATEFRHGIAFRFQGTGRIGNDKLRIDKDDAKKIRIADIVAASSCFPGGLEPLAFPDDFSWPDKEVVASINKVVRKSPYEGPVPLMDGGIYDNQGIESLWLAAGRMADRKERPLDMFVVSDVDQESEEYYKFPEGGMTGGLTIGNLNLLARALTLACLLTVLLVGFDAWRTLAGGGFTFWGLFRYIVPLFLAVVTAGALWWGRKTIGTQLEKIPHSGHAPWSDIRHIRVGQVFEMVQLRIGSLMAMASDIFMYHIRRLENTVFYSDEGLKGKRVSNLIYALRAGKAFFYDPENGKGRPHVPLPTKELQDVVETAATMESTLWWDCLKQQPRIVITGQVTLCYNLMKFLTRNCGTDPASYPDDVKALWDDLLADWNRFCEKPSWLLDELRDPASSPDPPTVLKE